MDLLQEIVDAGGGMIDVWSGGTFVPLGEGDLDIGGLMDDVVTSGFDGWIVIEQDVYPTPGADPEIPRRDSVTNRRVLSRWV